LPSGSTSGSSLGGVNQNSSSCSICQSGAAASVTKGSTGRVATARTMKSWKARAGARPPARPGRVRLSSRPIQTPVVIPLEKPMNQPSLFEVVVPVLPAVGLPSAAARPVP
jgi:hypothetical protein